MRRRILITGSRDWNDGQRILDALEWVSTNHPPSSFTVVHGGARGADTMAHAAAESMGMETEVHPADWDKHGKAAGVIRNQHMVNLGADICLAFPVGESRGTRHCMGAAHKAGIRVVDCSKVER